MGKAIPTTIANAPVLLPGLEFLYSAFLTLCTCRMIGMEYGPIPWTAINDYAKRYELNGDDAEYLFTIVKSMDACYLKYRQDNKKK